MAKKSGKSKWIEEAIVTSLERSLDADELHTRRLLAHTNLQAIAWINLTLKQITFTTLTK